LRDLRDKAPFGIFGLLEERNVAVACVDELDCWNYAVLGVGQVYVVAAEMFPVLNEYDSAILDMGLDVLLLKVVIHVLVVPDQLRVGFQHTQLMRVSER
jgi:hypothetical protein